MTEKKKGGHGAAIATAATVIGVGGVSFAYANSKYQDGVKKYGVYKSSSGSTGFWAWLLDGAPSAWSMGGGGGGGGGGGYTVNPTLSTNTSSVTLPGTFILSGTGYTKGGSVTVNTSPSIGPTTYTADGNGNFTSGSQTVSDTGASGAVTIAFTATDNTTSTISNTVSITFSSAVITPPSTTSPGNVLARSSWTGTGTYGSNTNPIAFGMWAVESGQMWSAEFTIAGYYQNPSGAEEMYFGSLDDAVTWLTSNGYATIQNSPAGSIRNPFVFGAWQGPGYYVFVGSSTTYYCTTETEYNSYVSGATQTGTATKTVVYQGTTYKFFYYDGNTQTLANEGFTHISGVPYNFAWNGYTGSAYYWWQALGYLSGSVISSQAQFNLWNAAAQLL